MSSNRKSRYAKVSSMTKRKFILKMIREPCSIKKVESFECFSIAFVHSKCRRPRSSRSTIRRQRSYSTSSKKTSLPRNLETIYLDGKIASNFARSTDRVAAAASSASFVWKVIRNRALPVLTEYAWSLPFLTEIKTRVGTGY